MLYIMADFVGMLKVRCVQYECNIKLTFHKFPDLNEAAVAKRTGLPYEGGHEIPPFAFKLLQVYTLFGML